MTLLSEARGLLLQAVSYGGRGLSESQEARMREVAWELVPCTCGRGPEGATHSVECLNGLPTPVYASA